MIFEVDKRDGKSKGQAEWVKRSKTVRRKKLRCEGGGERRGRQGWGKGWQQQWRAGKKENGGGVEGAADGIVGWDSGRKEEAG